jgi:serine/threonine-protein kinase
MERVLAGRYELEVPLGRGDSGEVWRGRDMATRRPVAVKVVEISAIDDPGLVAETIGRFRREATVIAGLRHPNIVGSLDAGRIANQLFMVMELAPGASLATMMDERGARGLGLFPVSSVLRIAEQVSLGLDAAHDAGIVHRDIKPSSLMATPQLDVKVIDFGIARLLADNSPRLTLRGRTVGGVAYMSPEQVQGDEVDGRADLYSLGCVLYQLLSGRLPFRSSLPSALLMMQVMDQAIPLGGLRPDLPAGLPELVSDLMEKDRAARPDTAAEVVSRIVAIGGAQTRAEPVQQPGRRALRAVDPADAAGHALDDDKAASEASRPAVLISGGLASLAQPDVQALQETVRPETQPRPEIQPRPETQPRPEIRPRPEVQPYPEPAGRPEDRVPQETVGVPPWELQHEQAELVPDPRAHYIQVGARDTPPSGLRISGSRPAVAAAGGGPPAARTGSGASGPARRPRHRWRGLLASLLVIVVAAGFLFYVWQRTHEKLTITAVSVSAAKKVIGCNGTAVIIGTITTNGHAGPIRYEWVRGADTLPPAQVSAPSGSSTVRVTLDWKLEGRGTGSAEARLRVLSPALADRTITVPYSCPS